MAGTEVTVERGHGLYRTMLLIRAFDEHAGDARRDGRLRGSVHEYIGEEAIATGVCANLRTSDYISSYHRGHGHCLAKGADPVAMMKELYGKAGGVCGGKGGSMHVADFSIGILGANGVVADGVTIAAGAAHAVKLRHENRIVVAFFGDGAMNRGPMLESLNWARVFDLPLIFVCEDNTYSDRTRTATVTGGPGSWHGRRRSAFPRRASTAMMSSRSIAPPNGSCGTCAKAEDRGSCMRQRIAGKVISRSTKAPIAIRRK